MLCYICKGKLVPLGERRRRKKMSYTYDEDKEESSYERFKRLEREQGTTRKSHESDEDYHRRVNGQGDWYEDY